MNKKLLICGAIATALLVTACVKTEQPKQDEQEQVEVQTEQTTETAQFEPLEPVESIEDTEPEMPAHVEVERTETANTTTDIRRETPTQPTAVTAPKAAAPIAEDKPTQARPSNNTGAQSEDDAVAAAIAAATPALEN